MTIYRVQYLDRFGSIVAERCANAKTAADVIELVQGMPWPVGAFTLRILDAEGQEVHSVAKHEFY